MNIKKLNEKFDNIFKQPLQERNFMWSFSTGEVYDKARKYIASLYQDLITGLKYDDLKNAYDNAQEIMNKVRPICMEAASISRAYKEANVAANQQPDKFEEIDAFYTKIIQEYLTKIEQLIEEKQ